jgi:DNA-binding transcriptional regulator YhcF (GntR family)
MLYQLDDLSISAPAFRILFSIIRRAYHSKTTTTSIPELMEKTKISRYLIEKSLKTLTEKGLIIIRKWGGNELKITLLEKIIDMIELDFKRRGAKKPSKASNALDEIKKSSSRKEAAEKTKKRSTAKTESTQTGSLDSLDRKTKKPKENQVSEKPILKKPEEELSPNVSVKEKPRVSGTKTASNLCKFNYIGERPEYLTVRSELYHYFQEWLKTNNFMSHELINSLSHNELQKKWNKFKEYSVTWLKLQKVISSPCLDLNKIRFMQNLAVNIEKAA